MAAWTSCNRFLILRGREMLGCCWSMEDVVDVYG